jgi:3-oxoacyl-[acyl-carrier-protein] synthase-3
MRGRRAVIAGVGHAEPACVRGNDDPAFDWIKANQPPGVDLFQGYVSRRVLAPDEDLIDILAPSARMAMADAGVAAADIDLLTGFGSLDLMQAPNPLALLHQKLGLSPRAWILPVANDYANFVSGLALAAAFIEAGRAEHVLVACASNWTRHVDYHTPQCVAAGDGAGAAVVSRRGPATASKFQVLDTETVTESALYGSMSMAGSERLTPPDAPGPTIPGYDEMGFSWPFFQITDRGRDAFRSFGETGPVEAVNRLLVRNAVAPSQVTLITHQVSTVLLDHWRQGIKPAAVLDTLEEFADIPHANQAVTLAVRYAEIQTEYLVLSTLGIEFSATAMLLRRG